MKETFLIFAFGTFGSPNGFKQKGKAFGNYKTPFVVSSFDLKTNAIQLFDDRSILYMLRKELVEDNIPTISYALYTFARERNSTRGGSFIGSAISFIEKKPLTARILNILSEFHAYLVEHNTDENHTLLVVHSDELKIAEKIEYSRLIDNQIAFENIDFTNSDRSLVYYSEGVNTAVFPSIVDRAEELLNDYDAIYFTNSIETAKFAQKKGIFEVVDDAGFESLFAKLEEWKENYKQDFIRELEQKRQRAIDYKEECLNTQKNIKDKIKEAQKNINEEINQLQQQIDVLKSKNQENNNWYNEQQKKIEEKGRECAEYSDRLKHFIREINNNKYSHKELKKERAKKQSLAPLDINESVPYMPVSSLQVASASKTGNKNKKQNGQTGNTNRSSMIDVISGVSNSDINNEKKNDIRWYIALAVFTIAFAFLIYFLTNKDTKEENTSPPTEQNVTYSEEKTSILTPSSNSILSDKDRDETIKKQLKEGITLNDVVIGIFKGNPKDIGTPYKGQESQYGSLLVEKNRECFEEKGGEILLKDSNLKEIPCYRN